MFVFVIRAISFCWHLFRQAGILFSTNEDCSDICNTHLSYPAFRFALLFLPHKSVQAPLSHTVAEPCIFAGLLWPLWMPQTMNYHCGTSKTIMLQIMFRPMYSHDSDMLGPWGLWRITYFSQFLNTQLPQITCYGQIRFNIIQGLLKVFSINVAN